MQLQEIEKSAQPETKAIAISATFTAEPISEPLAFWLSELDISLKIAFAPYNQIFQQLLDPNSLISQNRKGINIILLRLEGWEKQEDRSETKQPISPHAMTRIEQNVRELAIAVSTSIATAKIPTILCSCPASPAALKDTNRVEFFAQMEQRLKSELSHLSGCHFASASDIAALYPVENYYDSQTYTLGHIPYTSAYFTALGTYIARKIYTILNAPKKVIVLDCDNTLWKGVCGEDGAMGIEIDPPRKALQEFMVAQNDSGMLLCLCSKNNPEDVEQVFQQRKEMPLSRDRIVSDRINWLPKSDNIKSLAKELNLGLDSFIFIDDNPVECAEVQSNCPDVLTFLLPSEVQEIPRFLAHIWACDRLKVTEEDKTRTQLYQQNAKREQFRASSLTLENFLEGLGLQIEISEMTETHLARVSQLNQRTNQFNITTIRRSESEIQQLSSQGRETLVVEVKDRFGDYGLVGTLILSTDSDTLKVDTFLLSCRVLGRGVEHQMLAKLGKIALSRQLKLIEISYIPTQKNQPALDFLLSVGSPFKQPLENGSLQFTFPVEIAAAISYKPSAATENNADIKEKETPVSPNSAPQTKKHQTLNRIATELYDIEKLLKIVYNQKQTKRELTTAFIAPRTPTEKKLAEIFSQLLGIESVGIDDNFFELGGHSLLATLLMSRIHQTFETEPNLRSFFEAPTVAKLAEEIESQIFQEASDRDLAELLKQLEELSDSEIQSLLAKEAW